MKAPVLLASFLLAICVLTACERGVQNPSSITFIGIASGTLLSAPDSLQFRDYFDATEHDLVGVVALSHPADGTRIVATWFTPDERTRPIGQRDVLLESGATLARFSFGSTQDWTPAPYMLDIRVLQPDTSAGTEGERVTASGSYHFFIGLTQASAEKYAQDYIEWKRAMQEHATMAHQLEEREMQLLTRAQELLGSQRVSLAVRPTQIAASDWHGYVFIDTTGFAPFVPSPTALPLVSQPLMGMTIVDASGAVLLMKRSDDATMTLSGKSDVLLTMETKTPLLVTLLPTGSIHISWEGPNGHCNTDVPFFHGTWTTGPIACDGRP